MRAYLMRIQSGAEHDHTSTKTYTRMATLLKFGIGPAIMRLGGGRCLVDIVDDNGVRIEQWVADKFGRISDDT